MKRCQFAFTAALFALSTQAVAGGAPTESTDWLDPWATEEACEIAQDRLEAQATHWNLLGRTTWLIDTCALHVGFETGHDLLAFLDERLAAGMPPVSEIVPLDGRRYQVKLLLEVIGRIETLPADPATGFPLEFPAPATEAQATVLKERLSRRWLSLDMGINGVGITRAMGVPAVSMTFVEDADVRRYVAAALADGETPAPVIGTVAGQLVYAPLVMEVVGEIVIHPTGSISN